MNITKTVIFAATCFMAACCATPDNNDRGQNGQPDNSKDVVTYITSADAKNLFRKSTSDFASIPSSSKNHVLFTDDPNAKQVAGFGLAVTTASCYNLLRMSQEDRSAFLTEMFSKEKVGSSLLRVSIGASDFCTKDEYTWCDTPGLENFAVHQEDRDLLFPVLKEIYAINPDVKIIGSPWSCPRWMKCKMPNGNDWDANNFNIPVGVEVDNNRWTGGRLKPSCYGVYAEYFVKWIQTMQSEGFKIHAITMQNEPLNPGNSMSMVMPWQDQKEFIKVLGPALDKAGLSDVKILLYDHNYNYDDKPKQDNYPLNIYADNEAYKWAAGSAWHNYGGNVSELDNIQTANPEKDIYFTEASIGEWNYDFSKCLLNDFADIFLGTLSRGGRGVTLWNMMLDDKKGPYSPHDGSCKTCFGGVTIDSSNYKSIRKNSHWYNVAHASSVVKPGARMMNVSGYNAPSGVELLMFRNPDNSIGTLVCNRSDSDQLLVFSGEGYYVNARVSARSIASLLWAEK